MKVFLSWSGEQSKAVARALREWLPFIFPGSETWMSDRDLDAGVRWAEEIEGSLKGSNFGIICVTAGNRNSPWLNFEAGAISNNLSADGNEKSRVVPYLLDIGFPEVKGPLAQFHGKQANKAGTWELVQALNRISSQAHESGRLQVIFDRFWPDLEGSLVAIPKEEATAETAAPATRGAEDKLDELLLLVRSLSMSPSNFEAQAVNSKDYPEREKIMTVLSSVRNLEGIRQVLHTRYGKVFRVTFANPDIEYLELKLEVENIIKSEFPEARIHFTNKSI